MASTVAIVGRPNVGKSTLFNRLIEQRQAIMDGQSGITRDRHYGTALWNGKRFTVIDTGGYTQRSGDAFEKAVCKQIGIAVAEACVVLFMVDCKEGLTDADKDVADVLRRSQKPVLLVTNKADDASLLWSAHAFCALGLGEPYALSAISGSGTGELLDALVDRLEDDTEAPVDNLPKLAVIGRPNVGKSSFLNALLGHERTIVAPTAGTTRDATQTRYNLYGKDLLLVDTAGIRRRCKVKENVEFYAVVRAIRALQEADVCLIMIDAAQGLEGQELNLISLAHRYRKGIVLLVNKWDAVQKDQHTAAQYKRAMLAKLAPITYMPILFVSALKKQRIYQAVEKALEVYQSRTSRIATSALNQRMLAAIERQPPPSVGKKPVKIKYVTQLPTHAPNFAFFCNAPQHVRAPYKRYLENQLRQHFGLEGVPVGIHFRKK